VNQSLVTQITLENFLSYQHAVVPLGPLNVLIGPNGSGKSNLLEAFRLLQATPKDFTAPIREGGGINEWLYKNHEQPLPAKLEAILAYPQLPIPLRYGVEFTAVGARIEVTDEYVENEHAIGTEADVYFFYRYQRGNPVLNIKNIDAPQATKAQPLEYQDYRRRRLRREDLSPEQSVLSQRTDREIYPELATVGQTFAGVRLYADWDVSRRGPLRRPQPADIPNDFLTERADNLALVLNNLFIQGQRMKLITDLQQLYEDISDVNVKIEGGTVQLFLHEQEQIPIPTTRLSDGTLRFLCLLAVLRHPKPPPLLCIEEPELGLHPDLMPTIANLLMDAATRCQLIVTTHSDALISSLTSPETVLVCERTEQGSQIQRLEVERLKDWLAKYTLGDLWRMGEIGGNRW
jgi:predicted ATPase